MSITFSSSAPLGSVSKLTQYEPKDFVSTSAVLCRNTAPLISFAFALIRRGVGCRVLGKEFGTGLVTLVKKLNARSLDELEKKLEMYRTREVEKFLRKGEEEAAQGVRDKCDCIAIFIANADPSEPLSYLYERITSLFSDGPSGLLTLSTVHKAKGLEWPKVFILDKSKLMPSKFARTAWAKEQERNLIYVAITRAVLDLVYIDSGCWKPEKHELTPMETAAMQD